MAVDEVSLELERGTVHAVIGTNGAGKSTLINILSGEIPPSGGPRRTAGRTSPTGRSRAAPAPAWARSRLPAQHHLPGFSVFENCRLAAQAARCRALAWWRAPQRCDASVGARALAARRPGSMPARSARAGLLSHGRKRQLEIAMCLATAPEVLLLDEPLAGMGAEETERMLALLADCARPPSCWSSTTWTRCSASPTASR